MQAGNWGGAENGETAAVGIDTTLMVQAIPKFRELNTEDQARLREIASNLRKRDMPWAFIASSLRATAEVMQDLREEDARPDNVFQREKVRRFIQENAVPDAGPGPRFQPRRERKREERDRLHAITWKLLREARQARGRHEVKKTRNMLLKVDQREVRRLLGTEGEDLCRQINTWLRSTSAMF